MPALPADHTGVRIKRLRREHHLTQRALADLSGVSYSTLTKVEQGQIPASPHVTASIARALRISHATVLGQPYVDELRADDLDILIRPIREALDVYDLGPDPEISPRPQQLLAADAEALLAAVRAGEIKQAASQVAGLIQETTTAAHLAKTTEAWRLLASLYRTAYELRQNSASVTSLRSPCRGWTGRRPLPGMRWSVACTGICGRSRTCVRGSTAPERASSPSDCPRWSRPPPAVNGRFSPGSCTWVRP